MDVRHAVPADLPRLRALYGAARQAGAYREWGSGRADDAGIAEMDDLDGALAHWRHEVWVVEDDQRQTRGYVRAAFLGRMLPDEGERDLWRLVLGVIDPRLDALTWVRLYLGAVRAVVARHPQALWEGSVVADGPSDRLWQRYFAGERVVVGELAVYRSPAETVLARLGLTF